MEPSPHYTRLSILIAFISISTTTLFIQSDARSYAKMRNFLDPKLPRSLISESMKKLQVRNHLRVDKPLDSFKLEPSDVSSPFSLPPFDSLSPLPLPGNVPPPPFCINPPYTPQTPPKTPPRGEPPPPPPSLELGPNSPPRVPSPSPRGSVPRPVPSPSGNGSSPHPPPEHGPSPPAFLPPVVYPPPPGPVPPAHKKPQYAVWCVAKPTVPDAIMQEAMDYACGSGADCKSIQPNGSCFQPDTLLSHASYAFNSYWQNTKAGGGTCDFGGTAMLVTVDPSYEKCHFIYA